MASSIQSQSKRSCMDCIIHCSDEKTDKLVSPQDLDSWNSLFRAAKIRKHTPLLDAAKDLSEGEIPPVRYHRKCRSIFTLKKTLDKILASTKQPVKEKRRKSARQWSSCTSRVFNKACIFCKKTTKYSRRQKTREPLIQCCEVRADVKIRSAATRKMDSRILAVTSRDLVAAKGHYHRSCYKDYTREEPQKISLAEEEDDGEENNYEVSLQNSYNELFSFIRNDLFVNPRVLQMTELKSRLIQSMKAHGIDSVKDSTKWHLRRKLECEFGSALHIISAGPKKLMLYPDSLSLSQLAKEWQSLKEELNNLKLLCNDDILTKAALKIRSDIKAQEVPTSWPPQITEVAEIEDLMPESLKHFFNCLLTGIKDLQPASQRHKRLMNSLGQDIIYAVTNGKVKPPKHITLPFAVKSLTGNTELIHTLNRLGHSVSYSQLEEIDTALCLQKLCMCEGSVALPKNIHPGVFTNLAWDNIDRLEETMSGDGTSHRVNGIVIQAKKAETGPANVMHPIVKTKKRSIDAPSLMLPMYNTGQRSGPPPFKRTDFDTYSTTQCAKQKTLVWVMARMSEEETVSSWTGFNILTRNEVIVEEDSVGYLPTINAPATQMSTVSEVMNQSLNIMQSLQLQKIVCVFDQALYAKAAEVAWKHPEKFKDKVILRLGGFHTICTLMSVIGKRFQDAGLRDLCIESGVVAEGSIGAVMDGRKYNRAVRVHKLVYEALMRLAWKAFLPWLETNHTMDIVHLEETLKQSSRLAKDTNQEALREIMENASCTRIMQLFESFVNFLRTDNGELSAFWVSYLDMVDILLGLLRASREGDWKLHLASIRAMIPWCFAYDRLNYARYLPVYYAQMSELESEHPDVYTEFIQGKFSVQLGSNNPFGRIPIDQAIEETINKDTQTSGGTRGFSLKPGAIARYYLTAEYRSIYLRSLRNMISHHPSKLSHPDLQGPRILKDAADVQSLIDLMENNWINPMNPNDMELVSLSTGTLAPHNVTRDLIQAHDIGEKEYQTFRNNRLEVCPPQTKFYDKMSKINLKTFSHIICKTLESRKAKDVVLKADRSLFGHMILVAENRKLNLKDVLSHPLGPLPWALANADGTLKKTNKCALARHLEKNVSPAEEISKPSTCIIDGMSLVQKMNCNNKTFSQVAESILSSILHEGSQSERIDVVFDVYQETSIKDAERCNRGSRTSLQYKNIAAGHNVQQWRKFLGSSCNKISLIKFLVNEWKHFKYQHKIGSKSLFVTCEDACYKMTADSWEEVAELRCLHEEADGRLLLHAKHAADAGSKAVIIIAEDTDVLILCLAYCKHIPCFLYQKCGTQNRTRFIDITKLNTAIGDSTCKALVGLHAFTGCDTVSAFSGRGKIVALRQMKKNSSFIEAFSQLGQTWEVSPELFEDIQRFTCKMYSAAATTNKVNELRYQLFCSKRGEVESSQLPPCRDCLYMHTMRANFQSGVWRRCLESQPNVPNPVGRGWKKDQKGALTIEWMRTSPAPDAVIELLSCKCARECKLPICTCLLHGLVCTDMCKLQTCSNQKKEEEQTFEVGSDDENNEMDD